jgi:signal transduction histidine kinase
MGLGINFVSTLKPYPIDVIANILNALFIAYAILRYQLLDINVIVRRGFLQVIPTLTMVVAYFLIIYMTTRLFETLESPQILFIAIVLALITTTIAQPFHSGMQRWLEKALFREKYDSTMMIQRLSQISTTMLDLEELTGTILKDITETLHIEWAAFFLDQKNDGNLQLITQRGPVTSLDGLRFRIPKVLPQDSSELEKIHKRVSVTDITGETQALRTLKKLGAKHFIPLKARGEQIGVLITGPKWGDRPYTQEDELMLVTLANQTGVALDNARLHRQSRAYAEQLEQRVKARTNELQAQYARLSAILQSTSNGIVVVNDEGHIMQANPMVRTWLHQTLDAEDAAQLKCAIQNLASEIITVPSPAKIPTTILELKGIALALNAALVTGTGNPGPSTAVINIHDVSHLKALERMRARFVTHVSHELRTPVTAIKLYAHLIQQQPEKLATYLPLLIQQSDHQAQLIRDIVAIARLDSSSDFDDGSNLDGQNGLDVGQTTLYLRRMNLDDIASAVVDYYQAMAQQRGLSLIHHKSPTALTVIVNADSVKQALENVLKNAIMYTPKGGRVTIAAKAQALEGKTWATVAVVDTGIGIPKDEFPHIFDRFFRGEHPQAMQLAGTGLGLPVAQAIVQQHGGQMTVQSEEGVGSTFTLWLPLVE